MDAGCHACPSFAVGVGRGYPEIDEILTLARVWDSPPLEAGSEGNPAREWEFITSPPGRTPPPEAGNPALRSCRYTGVWGGGSLGGNENKYMLFVAKGQVPYVTQ